MKIIRRLKKFNFALCILFCSLLLCQKLEADNSQAALNTIKSLKGSLVIDSLALPKIEGAILPEIANVIAEFDLVSSSQAVIPAKFKFDNTLLNVFLKGGARKLEGNSALPSLGSTDGPAFGNYEGLVAEQDSKLRALKLLWNVVSLQEANRFLELKADISWTHDNRQGNLVSKIYSAYPGTLGLGQSVAMREKLQVVEPNWLSSFGLLTLRQYGENEDLLWLFSPTLNSLRELSGSLRSDQLFGSLFAPDDFAIFTGKPEMLEATDTPIFETLVPFAVANQEARTLKSEQPNCQKFVIPESKSSNPLSSIVFSPRKVFALELEQKDPFSLVGRQKLYVDAATMLPFFKEVYSQQGKLIKTVLGTFSLVTLDERTKVIPHTVIAFGSEQQISKMKIIEGRICNELPKDYPLKKFDPSQLAPAVATTPTKAPAVIKKMN